MRLLLAVLVGCGAHFLLRTFSISPQVQHIMLCCVLAFAVLGKK